MSVLTSRAALRWAVPAGVLVAILGAGAVRTVISASAGDTLPARSPAQLLADVASAQLDAGYGTVVERADLGLPSLPGSLGGEGSSNLNSLVSGSHTLRVWYSGPDKARVALLGSMGESDVIRNGTDVWTWSSATNTATHSTLPAGRDRAPGAPGQGAPPPLDPSQLPTTPQQAAGALLAAIDPSTAVSTADTVVVAGRSAYDLVLAPRDTASLVRSVNIAIDGVRHVPLRVQVYPKGSDTPAFEIGFTQVSFNRPDNAQFAFTPPPGATVTDGNTAGKGTPESGAGTAPATRPVVIGTGWTSVLAARMPQPAATPAPNAGGRHNGGTAPNLDAILRNLPTVSGTWGTGRLLQARLFSVLLTDDGRVLVGAVTGQRLLQAAADPAAALK